MKNGPFLNFEDVFPIKKLGNILIDMLVYQKGMACL